MSDARDLTTPESKPLTPANQNPWYVLMTLYGEQKGDWFDWKLHEKNRAAWNAWSCQGMSDALREGAAKSSGVPVEELSAWTDRGPEIAALHEKAWRARNPDGPDWPGMPAVGDVMRFDSCDFERPLRAAGYVLSAGVTFNHAMFRKQVVFQNAMFCEQAMFQEAIFSGQTMFHEVTFDGMAVFYSTTFSGYAHFQSGVFKEHASFESATFSDEAVFASATFSKDAWFARATFNGVASFGKTTFNEHTSFDSTRFEGPAYFIGTSFGAAGGDAEVNFFDCHFGKPANFRTARFKATYPDFEGAVLHPETTFTAEAGDVDGLFWPDAPKDPKAAKGTCAKIRNNLGKQGFPEAEHFFFRREMRFAGLAATNPAERGAYWLFGKLSDYGYSIARPARCLLGMFLAVGMLNHVVLQWGASLHGNEYHPAQAFALSFSNEFPLFGLQARWLEIEFLKGLNPWLKFLGGVQTVFALPLFFFLGLGLRTRFRLR